MAAFLGLLPDLFNNDAFNVMNIFRASFNGVFYSLPLSLDTTRVEDVPGHDTIFPLILIADSYSVGDRCYCHNIIGFEGSDTVVSTPLGELTAAEVCDVLGPGPGSVGRPLYNDLQVRSTMAGLHGKMWPTSVCITLISCPYIPCF